MARITIDVTSAYRQSAGIGRLTRETVRALLATRPSHALSLFCMGAAPNGTAQFATQVKHARFSDRGLHRLWFKLRLPVPVELFAGTRADLYHATDFVLPPTLPGTKTVLTVHDLTFERDPASAVPSLLAFLKRVVPASARKATHIVADSNATARDIAELYGIAPGNITTIYCGVDERFSPVAIAGEAHALHTRHAIDAGRYVLAVGTMQRRKNHLNLVRAFGRALASGGLPGDACLAIAGGKGWLYDEVLAEVKSLGLEARVKFLGFVDEADLPALYRGARVFAFPSLYEGFGIPLLEAMACGVPVVSSNTSSLPEVLGEVGLQAAPTNIDALSAALSRAYGDDAWRAEQIPAGMARAKQFTWQRAAAQLADVYNRVLNSADG